MRRCWESSHTARFEKYYQWIEKNAPVLRRYQGIGKQLWSPCCSTSLMRHLELLTWWNTKVWPMHIHTCRQTDVKFIIVLKMGYFFVISSRLLFLSGYNIPTCSHGWPPTLLFRFPIWFLIYLHLYLHIGTLEVLKFFYIPSLLYKQRLSWLVKFSRKLSNETSLQSLSTRQILISNSKLVPSFKDYIFSPKHCINLQIPSRFHPTFYFKP